MHFPDNPELYTRKWYYITLMGFELYAAATCGFVLEFTTAAIVFLVLFFLTFFYFAFKK